MRPGERDLVERTLDANRRLVRRNAEPASPSTSGSDSDPLFDAHRSVIPHTRSSMMYRLARSDNRHSHAVITAEKVFLATLFAAVSGVALGFDRPDWAVVSALLMLQWGPDRIPGQVRGLHRLVGSLLGIAQRPQRRQACRRAGRGAGGAPQKGAVATPRRWTARRRTPPAGP
ncbi:FUSC family protein [Corynebacterium qintianiae]|uniref:FUSC family protein n=1 Tax=Corynebacterium qintianiae TaxID=2709392 RepID=UPI001982532B|nr:FUSC family protein [Corynebacterium qintianiae]